MGSVVSRILTARRPQLWSPVYDLDSGGGYASDGLMAYRGYSYSTLSSSLDSDYFDQRRSPRNSAGSSSRPPARADPRYSPSSATGAATLSPHRPEIRQHLSSSSSLPVTPYASLASGLTLPRSSLHKTSSTNTLRDEIRGERLLAATHEGSPRRTDGTTKKLSLQTQRSTLRGKARRMKDKIEGKEPERRRSADAAVSAVDERRSIGGLGTVKEESAKHGKTSAARGLWSCFGSL